MTHARRPAPPRSSWSVLPAGSLSLVGRMLTAALQPTLVGALTRIRRSETRLANLTPRSTVVAVLGVTPATGGSSLAALLAQGLAALAPGRVAAVDGDSVAPTQRARLNADLSGGLFELLSSSQAWRTRRAVDRHLAHGGTTPLLAVGQREPRRPLTAPELATAVRLVRRRYPIVVVDLPSRSPSAVIDWAARQTDHIVIVGPVGSDQLRRARLWLSTVRPDNRTSFTVVGVQSGVASVIPPGLDTVFSADPALSRPGVASLTAMQLHTVAAVSEVVARTTTMWRTRTSAT